MELSIGLNLGDVGRTLGDSLEPLKGHVAPPRSAMAKRAPTMKRRLASSSLEGAATRSSASRAREVAMAKRLCASPAIYGKVAVAVSRMGTGSTESAGRPFIEP